MQFSKVQICGINTSELKTLTEKEKISIKKFISQPDIYLKKLYINIKDTLKFITGKSIYVRNCAIIIFSAHFICAVSGKHSIMLRKYIHTGITSPLTLFIIGIINFLLVIFFSG